MKPLIRICIIILCSLTIISALSGCNGSADEESKPSSVEITDTEQSKPELNTTTDTEGSKPELDGTVNVKESRTYPNGMTASEKSKVVLVTSKLCDQITLLDEEIGSIYEIDLLKSSSYDPSKPASLYLVHGAGFNEIQVKALNDYLNSKAPQTLLAIINSADKKEAAAEANRDFVENPQAYQAFLTDNMLGWLCENYKIDTDNICFAGYETAGYFTAFLLHNSNSVANYLLVNPELSKRTEKLDISEREAAFFTGGNTTLSANVCIFRSEDDRKILSFKKTEDWIKALNEHNYQGLTINNTIMAGAGHNTIDCEALLRGICYFDKMEYSDKEASCVDASKAMTTAEMESITIGKLSKEHEFYKEVIGIDPDCAEYISEIKMYDEEINDSFIIHVSLPPNYDKSKSYPLVLMTDGIWRLSDHPELHKLMISDEVEDVILVSVGYPNGYDYFRIRERDLLRQPDLFLQYLTENLVPYLYDNYSVDTSRTTLTGHSYGGYWALYALYHSDTIGKDTFANYYIGSPSFQATTSNAIMTEFEDWFYERKQALPYSVYVTVGGDEEPHFISLIEGRLNDIKKHTYEGLTMKYELLDGYNHNTVFKPSIKNALKLFYGSK